MTTVEPVDVYDDRAYAELHAAYLAAHDHDFDAPEGAHEWRVHLMQAPDYVDFSVYVAWDDAGRVVGGGLNEIPQKDNLETVYAYAFVVPHRRRAGHGTAIVDILIDDARRRGRVRALAETTWGVADKHPAGPAFLTAHGFTLGIRDAVRAMSLPSMLPEAPMGGGYRLVSWIGACPEKWVDEYAELRRILLQEAPAGDLEVECEFFDAGRIRFEEAEWAKQHRIPAVTLALGPDGSVVGHTQLVFPHDDPLNAYQWDTLVERQHRGHGLGLSMKVANMHAAADLLTGRARIYTWNAASNAHMIAVNEAMGYRLIAHAGEYARPL